jgi:hypothetical protein
LGDYKKPQIKHETTNKEQIQHPNKVWLLKIPSLCPWNQFHNHWLNILAHHYKKSYILYLSFPIGFCLSNDTCHFPSHSKFNIKNHIILICVNLYNIMVTHVFKPYFNIHHYY